MILVSFSSAVNVYDLMTKTNIIIILVRKVLEIHHSAFFWDTRYNYHHDNFFFYFAWNLILIHRIIL